jgi:hypothetical protein
MDLPKRLRNLVPTRTSNKAQRAKVDGELRLKVRMGEGSLVLLSKDILRIYTQDGLDN